MAEQYAVRLVRDSHLRGLRMQWHSICQSQHTLQLSGVYVSMIYKELNEQKGSDPKGAPSSLHRLSLIRRRNPHAEENTKQKALCFR